MTTTIQVSGPGIDRRVTLTEGAGELTVGRDPAADVHLPDPEKAISRKHLAMRLQGGAIEFRVVSSINGVTSSKGEVPPGASGVLAAGETLTLGSYTLVASAAAPAAVAPPAAEGTSMTAATRSRTPGSDPLDIFAAFAPARGAAARSDDPFSRPEFNPAAAPTPTLMGGDPFAALLGTPKPAAKPAAAAPGGAAAAGGLGAKGPDPMALLAGNQQQVAKQTGAGQINEWLSPGSSTGAPGGPGVLPPGFGGPARHDRGPLAGPLSTDHVHDFNLPLKLPTAPAAPAAPAAGDPWAALMQSELGTPAATPAPAPAPAPPQPAAPVPAPQRQAVMPPPPAAAPSPMDDPFASLEQAFGDDPFSEWATNTAPLAAGVPAPAAPPSAALVQSYAGSAVPAPPPPAAVAAPPAAAVAAAPAAPAAAPGADGALVAALFGGLGLPVPKDFDAAGAQHIGTMTRLIVEGFADLLAARAALKRELRAEDRTMLNARGNNPLKLGLTTDQLLQFLFASSAQGAAYMAPQRAMKETVTELRAHEIATIAASRAAVQGAIQDFEPTKLKAKLTKGKSKLPQFLDNARLWDMYQQHYAEQQQQMADWLDKLFDRHFMPVYSKESDRIRSAMEAQDLSDPVPRPK